MQVMKNLVIGGVDIHLREHNQKGFRVKESRNLHFNNGFIRSRGCLKTLDTLVADVSNLQTSTLDMSVCVVIP